MIILTSVHDCCSAIFFLMMRTTVYMSLIWIINLFSQRLSLRVVTLICFECFSPRASSRICVTLCKWMFVAWFVYGNTKCKVMLGVSCCLLSPTWWVTEKYLSWRRINTSLSWSTGRNKQREMRKQSNAFPVYTAFSPLFAFSVCYLLTAGSPHKLCHIPTSQISIFIFWTLV